MRCDLSRLLRPRSIAVVGGGWGVAVVEQCLKIGFSGDIWPVHPTRAEVAGKPCWPSIDALPRPPDATFIGINRHATIDAVSELSRLGAGGAVCFASGFAEAADDQSAGASLQDQLVAAAGSMPVIGPNCYGLINYLDGALLWPDQHGGRRVESGVAILGQSSNMLINLTMQQRGLPVSYVVAAGNQAQIGLADIGAALLDDPRVSAIGLHIEGISDIQAFEVFAAKARTACKPLVTLKVGRTAESQAATLSHTASLAGTDAASRAFLARLGVPVVASLPEFLETLKLAHVHGALPGRALGSVSCSGGEASLIADAAFGRDVYFKPLAPLDRERIQQTLSDLVTVSNPLDYHTFIWGDVPRMTDTFSAMMQSGFDLTCLIYDLPRTDRCDDAAWECGIEAGIAASQRTGARVAMVASLPENLPEHRADQLFAAGIVPLCGFEEAMVAAEAMANVHDAWEADASAPVLRPTQVSGEVGLLDEAKGKAALAAHGVPVPNGATALTPQEAGQAAAKLGFPVALKGLGLAHKTEAGAVRLNLTSRQAVADAAAEMQGISGFLVEAMVSDAVAEVIVGVVRDPVYGFTLTIGAGGVLAELLEDTRTLLIPASETSVRAALASLKVMRLLRGYRGKPAAHLDAVVTAILAVQAYVMAEGHGLEELDVNPLMATPTGAVAVDVLIRRWI